MNRGITKTPSQKKKMYFKIRTKKYKNRTKRNNTGV